MPVQGTTMWGMVAQWIDGKAVSAKRREALKERVAVLSAAGIQPCLVGVGMGNDHGWEVYTRNQAKACEAIGVRYWRESLASDASQDDLAALIEGLNTDPSVHGIIVQSPLPDGLDERAAQALLAPSKDVEAVNPANLGLVLQGREVLAPCTAQSAVALAEEYLGDLRGVDTVVVGSSVIVGRPLAQLLLSAGATVTTCHIDTKDLAAHTTKADLLIVAVGKAGLITPELVKPGATIIDVGINRIKTEDGKTRTVGDVAPEVAEVAAAMSPVPGGVGSLTTTILLESTVAAAELASDRPQGLGAAGMARLLGETGTHLPPELLERLARMLSAHLISGSLHSFANPLLRRLGKRLMVMDGAMGTELLAAGVTSQPLEQANLDEPDKVLSVHNAYLEAGAQALTSNTFRCNRFAFGGDRQQAISTAQAGIRLARQAAAGNVPVLASIGPLGPKVGPGNYGEQTHIISEEQAEEAAAEVALAMIDAGADGFMLETMPSTREAVAIIRGIQRVGSLPILVSRAIQRNDLDELRQYVHTMEKLDVAAIGLNCSGGPRHALPILRQLTHLTQKPVFAFPNAGFPTADESGNLSYHLEVSYFKEYTQKYMAAGASIVGGCCGVSAHHIAAISDFADAPIIKPPTSTASSLQTSSKTLIRRRDPILQQLLSDELAVIAMIPGRLHVDDASEAACALGAAGCSAIGLSSAWPGSSGALGNVAARLRRLSDQTEVPSVLEIPAPVIDLAKAEAALSDAHQLGIRHVLIDTGIFSNLVGESARGVDPIHLLALIAEGNRGYDLAGVRLEEAWDFTVGLRLGAEHCQKAAEYQQEGADFICLQPIYEAHKFRQAMAQIAESGCTCPLLAEILVLPDAETAEEINYEVPLLSVPERLRMRLRENPDEDSAGVLRFLGHWRDRLSGVMLMLPDQRTAQAEAVLRGLDLPQDDDV